MAVTRETSYFFEGTMAESLEHFRRIRRREHPTHTKEYLQRHWESWSRRMAHADCGFNNNWTQNRVMVDHLAKQTQTISILELS